MITITILMVLLFVFLLVGAVVLGVLFLGGSAGVIALIALPIIIPIIILITQGVI